MLNNQLSLPLQNLRHHFSTILAQIRRHTTSCKYGNSTGPKSIEIPDSVTKIADYAFWRCTVLTSIDIPNSVTEVAVFDYIYDIQFGNGKYGDENDDKYMPNQLWILLEGLVSVSGDEFDFNGFLKEWNDSYFEDWKAFY